PFNSSTTVRFNLPAASRVRIVIYNVAGQLVRELANGMAGPGAHVLEWDGTGADGRTAAPGVYVCRLDAGGMTRQIKLVLMR
ncbi:MAG: FlgD immunoglobulin-like domain containing protein, partial [Candidatus Edwardsbacteria bacterium]|nr:FlgD immunoglobulin-like domain containing protein [Candidatus Edwardsbacteria bacterium]